MPKSIEVGKQNRRTIRLTPKDRSTHLHVIGASGKGKSKAIEAMIRQDIKAGHGVCLIDPHGTLYDDLVQWCAYHDVFRHRTIHLINPGSEESTVGFNPLWVRPDEDASRRVDRVVDACAKVWGGEDTARTPRLSKVLTCVFYALAVRNLTMVEAPDLLSTSNKDGLRKYLSSNIEHALFARLWQDFNALPARELHEYFESADSRFVRFLASPTIQAMLGSRERPIDFRKSMDNDEIVLINLQESGRLSFANASVIGALISNELFSLASGRPPDIADRHPFYFYIDECYRFLSDDIEDMLNQTRKRGLHVTLVHHYLEQLRQAGDGVYHAVMTNAQTKLVFGGTSDEDAEILTREIFRTEFDLDQTEEKLMRPSPTGTYRRVEISSYVESDTTTIGSGFAAGSGVGRHYDESGDAIGGYVETTQSGSSDFSGNSHTSTYGTSEVLVPNYAIMATALKSPEKVVHEAIALLRALGPQFAILKSPNKKSFYVKIPFVRPPIVTERTVDVFIGKVNDRSEYTMPRADALRQIETRRDDLVHEASGATRHMPDAGETEEDDQAFLQ